MSYPEGSGAARSIEEARNGPKITVVANERVREARRVVEDLSRRLGSLYTTLGDTTPDQPRLREDLRTQIKTVAIELVRSKAYAYDLMRVYEIMEPKT